jgi:hypothetical protein
LNLVSSAKRGGKGVEDDSKKLIKENALLAKKAKSAANTVDDPIRKRELLQAANDLEALLPLVAAAVKVIIIFLRTY